MTVTLDRPSTLVATTTLTLVPLTHPSLRAVRSWADQQAVHLAVMGLFGDNLPGDRAQRRATGAILHRHDTPANGPARLLIQHAIPMRPVHNTDPSLQRADLTPLLTNLRPDQPIRFRIVLNAVRSQTGTKKRIPVTDPDDLIGWGLERLTAAGLHQIQLSDQPGTHLASAKAALWTAQYDGHALIADPDLTRHALLHGIGRAKAYGCGLLSLAPTRT